MSNSLADEYEFPFHSSKGLLVFPKGIRIRPWTVALNRLDGVYDVFDEERYFNPSKEEEIKSVTVTVDERKTKLGVEICEDLWDEEYDVKVTDLLAERGAEVIVNISASPFYVGKRIEREKQLIKKAIKNSVPIFYVNLFVGLFHIL